MMNPDREAILQQVEGGKLSRAKAGKMLKLSRQYVGTLVKERKEKKMAPPASPPPAAAAAAAPAPAPFTIPDLPEPDPPAVPAGKDAEAPSLADILKEADAPPPGAPLPPTPPPPRALPPAFDPEDAEAGEELLEMGRFDAVAYVGTRIFGLKVGDPRLAKLKEPNKFLKRALKRNGEKTAMIGRLTGGILGVVIGYGAEIARAIFHFAGLGIEPVASSTTETPKGNAPAPGEAADDEDAPPPAGSFSISAAKAEAERRP